MPGRAARGAGDGGARSRRREGARDRPLDGVLADDGDDNARSLACRRRGRAGEWGVVCAAAAGPALVSVGAQRGREQRILDARARTNWGPMRLTWLTGRHRSTCWKVLHRHGVSCQRRTERPQTTRRYEWAEAGALLHIDAFELPKFEVPGHWAHGDRAERHRTRRAGKVKVIGVIDDHTRLAYCELHGAENAITVSATLRRAARWFREQGCGPVREVMGDNARCSPTSPHFRDTLADLGARHILIPPRTPRWNGKIERFFRTLDTEWAHGRVWPNSTRRDRALSSFMRFYNRRRPHSAAGGRPPISRVQQVRKQNS